MPRRAFFDDAVRHRPRQRPAAAHPAARVLLRQRPVFPKTAAAHSPQAALHGKRCSLYAGLGLPSATGSFVGRRFTGCGFADRGKTIGRRPHAHCTAKGRSARRSPPGRVLQAVLYAGPGKALYRPTAIHAKAAPQQTKKNPPKPPPCALVPEGSFFFQGKLQHSRPGFCVRPPRRPASRYT